MKILLIAKKELIDQLRDKRTIIAAILMPALIVPLLLFVTSENTQSEHNALPLRIIIISKDNLIRDIIFRSYPDAEFTGSASPQDKIIKGEAEVLIDESGTSSGYPAITLYYDSARSSSAFACIRIYDLLESALNRKDIRVQSYSIASVPIRSEKESRTLLTLSLLLPVLIMVFAASSAMSPAVDMTSGEKERSTIETLLSCCVTGKEIITGKVLAASVTGLASVISLIAGITICSALFPEITGGLSLPGFCGFWNLFLIFSITLPVIILFASAGIAIGLFAKSVKEGTIFSLPVIILSSVLSTGLFAGDPFSISRLYSITPVLNISIIIRSVLYNSFDPVQFSISGTSNLFYSYILLIISSRLLKKESVIFRS